MSTIAVATAFILGLIRIVYCRFAGEGRFSRRCRWPLTHWISTSLGRHGVAMAMAAERQVEAIRARAGLIPFRTGILGPIRQLGRTSPLPFPNLKPQSASSFSTHRCGILNAGCGMLCHAQTFYPNPLRLPLQYPPVVAVLGRI